MKNGLRASDLRERITIQENQRVSDGAGGFSDNWVNIHTVWAKVVEMGGGLNYLTGQFVENTPVKVHTRYINDLKDHGATKSKLVAGSFRLVYKGNVITIHSPINVNELNWQHEISGYINGC